MVLGLDASYHHVASEHGDIPDFYAFAIGTHVLFGW